MATEEIPVDFTTALRSYKSLDLPSLQTLLTTLIEPLTTIQTNSLTSRKKLAEQTREFKKLKDEEKLESYKRLLKAYQAEIDELTKRSRDAEGGVAKVHDKLKGVPDPHLVLEKVLDTTANISDVETLKEQNTKLQRDNELLRERVESNTTLQADRDQLAERLTALQSSFDNSLDEATSSIESQVTARFDERLSNATAREAELTRSLSLAQEQLKQLRTTHDSTTERLLSSTSAHDGSRQGSASAGEYDMIAQDLRRANERIATVEKRNEQLREQVEKARSGRTESEAIRKLESRLKEAEEEKSKAQALWNREEEAHLADQKAAEHDQQKLRQSVQDCQTELASLHDKLDAQSDYEELKRELSIIRYVEFSNGLEEEDSSTDNASAVKPLEALLLEKNKKLQDDLTTLRVAHNELTQSSTQTFSEVEKSQAEIDRLTKLVEKLENDLMEVGVGNQAVSSTKSTRNGVKAHSDAPMSAEEALDELDRLGKGERITKKENSNATEGTSPALEASNGSSTPATAATPFSAQSANPKNDSSVLPIIISQRDRFRSRNAELEEELRKQFDLITSLRTEIKTLQADNLSLYEKVRYLQSYASSSSSSSAPAHINKFVSSTPARDEYPPRNHRNNQVPVDIASGSMGDKDGKYRAKYEQSMNPFEAFRGREQSRAMSSLNPLEKLLHMFSTMVLQDRRMRIGFMIYAVGMHLFIFGILLDYTFVGAFDSRGATANVLGTACAAPMDPVPS
ncbi:unnamed protein product [Sympodiomycopsis kandeliae]